MEPLFFKAENSKWLLKGGSKSACFNGAAFFQSGKPAALKRRRHDDESASMEPLFFKAENYLPERTMIYATPASMEPLFFKAENGPADSLAHHGACFNGAAFFQSGKPDDLTLELPEPVDASMEPLFFKAENAASALDRIEREMASMEPLFFKAENNQASRAPPRRRHGFNGAAFFQSGKQSGGQTEVKLTCASMEPLFFKAEN